MNNTEDDYLTNQINSSYIYLAKPVYIYEVKSELNIKFDELANNIDSALLKGLSGAKSYNKIYYVFEVQETIKGDDKKHITISFFSDNDSENCDLLNNYNNHNDELFWSWGVGRSIEVNSPESHLIHSCFVPGNSYLLLKPYYLGKKSYELISSPDDKWLKFVRDSIKK